MATTSWRRPALASISEEASQWRTDAASDVSLDTGVLSDGLGHIRYQFLTEGTLQTIYCYNFGFESEITSATDRIDGIEIELDWKTSNGGRPMGWRGVFPTKAGLKEDGLNVADLDYAAADSGGAVRIYGASDDVMGTGLLQSELTSSLGFFLTARKEIGGSTAFELHGVRSRLHYTPDGLLTQMELTGLIAGSEVRAYSGAEGSAAVLVSGTDSSGTTYSFTQPSPGAGFVIINSLGYENIFLPVTYGAANQSIPIQQQVDRSYENPA